MADISQISDGTTTWDIKDATARSSIANAITTAGTGLSKSGNTLNHSNAVTAGTAGCTFKYDAQGHIAPNGAYEHRLSVAANGNAGSAGRWYKVCTLPVNNSSNMATLIIEGRFGDYLVTRASYGRFLVGNRNGLSITCDFLTPNNSVASTEGLPAAFSKVDVVCYTQTDGTVNVYLKCVNYYFFDFVMRLCNNGTDAAYYGTYTYDGTYVTTAPSGTLDAQASTASGGVFNAPRIRSSLVQANTSYYGTCSTAASTAAKVVTCSSFVLATGARISVLFTTAQTAQTGLTLNVNSTGAKDVWKDGAQPNNDGNCPVWPTTNVTAEFIYDGSHWVFLGATGIMHGPRTLPTNLNITGRGGIFQHYYLGATVTNGTGKAGHYFHMQSATSNYLESQFFVPVAASERPAWRTNPNGTWTAWDYLYTTANPIIATASQVGGVKPDGQSIIVSSDGTITATPAAVGMTCTERSGGVSLDTYDLETNSIAWPADGGWGWREEVWNDGRMTLYWWKWFATTGSGWQQLWTNLPYPTDATSFVDTPNTQVSLFDNAASVQGAAMIKPTSLRTSSNTTGFKMTYYNSAANTNAKTLVLFRADGHWWKENVDPDDPTPAEEWAVGDAITIGGNSYYPVTEWKVSDSGAGGDSRLKAAVRFLITTSSTSGAWHVYAQYAAWTDSGYVPTSSQNGYMLIRKLNSQITTYTNDAGVKAKGDVWSALNTNQRQGYVSNGVVEGHLIWGDTPYIITDCGTFTNGQTVSSKTFYVGTTEVNGGVYTQTSVSDTTTTPTSN